MLLLTHNRLVPVAQLQSLKMFRSAAAAASGLRSVPAGADASVFRSSAHHSHSLTGDLFYRLVLDSLTGNRMLGL